MGRPGTHNDGAGQGGLRGRQDDARLRSRLRTAAAVLILAGVVTAAIGYAGILSAATGTSTATSSGAAGTGGFVSEVERFSPPSGDFAVCSDCHSLFDPPAAHRPLLTDDFGHITHLERGAQCADCHQTPVHTEAGTRRPGMADCFTCHGQDPGAAAPGECALCHPPDMPLVPSSHTVSFYAGGHATVIERDGTRECFVCHEGDEESFCTGCHGLAMPHPEGWTGTAGRDPGDHVDWAYQDAVLCVRCHDNTTEPAPPGCYQGECHGP